MAKYFRLKDTSGMFFDSETGFNVCRDEVAEHPKGPLGKKTREWKKAGGLIETDPPKPKGDEPEAQAPTKESSGPSLQDRITELKRTHTKPELQKLCGDLGIKYTKKETEHELATKIAAHERGGKK